MVIVHTVLSGCLTCLQGQCLICVPFVFQQKGTRAPQAAGKIHTDFEKGFIMAEVMKYDDFKEEGTENAVKVGVS